MEKIIEYVKNNVKFIMLGVIVLLAGSIFYFMTHAQRSTRTILPNDLVQISTSRSSEVFDETVKKNSNEQNSSKIEVDLKGAVVNPDVYQLSSGTRVDDLIKLAGGFTKEADLKTVNLAAKLKDEEVVYVATIGEKAAPVTSSAVGNVGDDLTASSENAKVNINTADLTELQTLSGIGAKKAQDIIDYRTQNGLFQTVDDLGKVSGFGDKTLAKLKDSICVD